VELARQRYFTATLDEHTELAPSELTTEATAFELHAVESVLPARAAIAGPNAAATTPARRILRITIQIHPLPAVATSGVPRCPDDRTPRALSSGTRTAPPS
jgi:hypothetical protein